MISYELQVVSWYFKKINLRVLSYFWELQSQKNKFTSSRLYFSSCIAVLRVENLFYVLKTFFMNCFLFESRALLISNTFITNLKLRFGWISSGAYSGFTILSVALLPENSPVSLAVALWNTFLKAAFRGSTTVLVEVSKNFFLYSLVRFLENYKTHVYIYSYP